MFSKKGVPVELDRMRTIRFTTNTMVTTEQMTGVKMMAVDPQKASFTEWRALAFAGLYADDPKMTLIKAGDLLDIAPPDFYDKLVLAMQEDNEPVEKFAEGNE